MMRERPCKAPVAGLSARSLSIVAAFGLALAAPARAQDSTAAEGSGGVEFLVRNRSFLIPDRVVGGLKIQPTVAVRWSPFERLRLAIDAQTVDNSGPGRQGEFAASRTVPGSTRSGNFAQELALEARALLWRDPASTRLLWMTGALSRGVRSYRLSNPSTGVEIGGNRRQTVPTLASGMEWRSPRGGVQLGAAAAWLPATDALYLRTLPGTSDRFGTVLGPEVIAELSLGGALSAFGRGFAPMTGRNTIDRASGRTVRAAAYDAGLRLAVHPGLSADLFVSNALGNTGALAYVVDREYAALGAGVSFRPWDSRGVGRHEPRSTDSVAASVPLAIPLISAWTLPRGHAVARISGNDEGLATSVQLSPVDGFDIGAFLDYPRALVDEGELGLLGRLRMIDERMGAIATVGVVVAVSRTNNPLINLLAGRPDELKRRGLGRGGLRPGDENETEGRLYTITGALPFERWLASIARVRVAPVVAYVEREGVQLAGAVLGVEGALGGSVALSADAGADLESKGNVLSAAGRSHAIPWRVGLSWRPELGQRPLILDLHATNRTGESPFHVLRVRSENRTAYGIGAHFVY